ncbi:leucine-rich repeat domain-containing protein [Listeria floridensis]|nr:leucine-rich repeat domain-containing protein [Listeria floridensis]
MKKSWAVVPTAALLVSLGSPMVQAVESTGQEKGPNQSLAVSKAAVEPVASKGIQTQAEDPNEVKSIDEWIPNNPSLALRVKEEVLGEFEPSNLVSRKQLESLERLTLEYWGDDSLAGIGVLKGLQTLNIYGDVKDYTPLRGLPNLLVLNLYGTNCTNLDFLEGMAPLNNLMVQTTELTSVEGLRHQTALATLDISNNSKVTDWSPLNQLTTLRGLNVAYCGIDDYSFIQNMTKLTRLNLDGNPITKVEGLQALPDLKFLTLGSTPLEDFSGLKGLDLIRLNVSHTGIHRAEDLALIEDMINLEELYMSDNQLTEVPSFTKLTKLKKYRFSTQSTS